MQDEKESLVIVTPWELGRWKLHLGLGFLDFNGKGGELLESHNGA